MDKTFLTDGRPNLTSRQAALYVGYEPNDVPCERDHAMKAFYAWVQRHAVPTRRRGRTLIFKRSALDAALDRHSAPAVINRSAPAMQSLPPNVSQFTQMAFRRRP